MLNKVKKIVYFNFVLLLCIFSLINVKADEHEYEYEYVDTANKTPVELKREEIYDLSEMYDFIMGGSSNNPNLINYSGVCSMVTVEGSGTYPLDEYVAGVLKHEVGVYGAYPEYLKAQAIAARSFVVASKSGGTSCTVPNSASFQVFSEIDPNSESDQRFLQAATETSGMVVSRNGEVALTQYMSYPNANYSKDVNGKWTVTLQKFSNDPSTEWTWVGSKSKDEIQGALGYYAGAVSMSNNHHYGMSQTIGAWLGHEGYSYTEIIDLFYGTDDSSLSVLTDGKYDGEIEYVDSEFGEITYWNQLDYPQYYYSSNVNEPQYVGSSGNYATIKSHGCGPTSLAIVLSSFTGTAIHPATVTQLVCQAGGCYDSGTSFGSLKTIAERYGYDAEFVNKNGNVSKVTNALASGDSLVIALMGPGTFTSGGHYIVLTGTRSDGYVSVADPASRPRTNQKWFSFNLVIEEAQSSGFLIITK